MELLKGVSWKLYLVSLVVATALLHVFNSFLNLNTSKELQPLLLTVYVGGVALGALGVVVKLLGFKKVMGVKELITYLVLLFGGLLLLQIFVPGLIGDANIFVAPVTQSVIPFDFELFRVIP
jgi:hypothetical protein